MSKGKVKRVFYDCHKFPFERLRLGTTERGRSIGTDWTHWSTFLASTADPTRFEEYGVKFPRQNSGSITLYLSKEGRPSLYLYQEVHCDWSKPGADGKAQHLKSVAGTQVEDFWNKWYDTVIALMEQVPMPERIRAMGAKVAGKPLRDAIDHPLRFQKYPDDYEDTALAGLQNPDKSKQIRLTVWSKDLSNVDKDTTGGDSKQKQKWQDKKKQLDLARARAQEGPQDEDTEGTSEIVMPGSDLMLMTNFYDLTSEEANPTGAKSTRYDQIRRFVHCKAPHPGASGRYSRLSTKAEVVSPTIAFKRTDNADGEVKIKARDLYVLTCTTGSHNTNLQPDKLELLKREREEERLAQGITDEAEGDGPNKSVKTEAGQTPSGGAVTNTNNSGVMMTPEEEAEEAEHNRLIELAAAQVPKAPTFGPAKK